MFVYVKGKKGKRKAAEEVWGPEMRGSPWRRDVAGLCLQASETQDAVVLFISMCAFIMVRHTTKNLGDIYGFFKQFVQFSGSMGMTKDQQKQHFCHQSHKHGEKEVEDPCCGPPLTWVQTPPG